jgi:hypothetical protein
LVPKPSISVSNWFSVFSSFVISAWHIVFFLLLYLQASISSMKMIGDFSLACLNRSRTRDVLHQTFQQNQPDKEEESTCSPATALLIKFFLFQEALQVKSFGNFTTKMSVFLGFFSRILQFLVSLLSLSPATSLNVVLRLFFSSKFCFWFYIENLSAAAAAAWHFSLIIKIKHQW